MRLAVFEPRIVTVEANAIYGGDPRLEVNDGEIYTFECLPHQRWSDWILPAVSPDGGFNPVSWLFRPRLKDAQYFCLCGAIGENESHLFKIGSQLSEKKMMASGPLCLFANDYLSRLAYKNNRGRIQVKITRLD